MTDKLELPSGLPEGPWTAERTGGYWIVRKYIGDRIACDIALIRSQGLDVVIAEAVARAIASIPDMVEEIGRLRSECETHKLAVSLASSELCRTAIGEMAILEMDRLRALNAELREALSHFANRTIVAHTARGESLVGAIEHARAILAKSQEPAP